MIRYQNLIILIVENNPLINQALQGTNFISTTSIIFSITLSFVLSFILSKVYKSQAQTLSNPEDLASIFPFLSIGVTIIIIVVKSSLALSLGLVGALSIVRFRTPIKEPEELTYIFLCIGIGIATGASQFKVAYIGLILTTLFIYLYKFLKRGQVKKSRLSLHINGLDPSHLNNFINSLKKYSLKIEFNNMSLTNDNDIPSTSLSITILGKDFESLSNLVEELKNNFPSVSFNIIDTNTIY